MADSVLRQRHLIFHLDAGELREGMAALPEGMTFREVARLDGLPASDRQRLVAGGAGLEWGDAIWFEEGWRLWTGFRHGSLACLGWVRNAAQSRHFFIPLPEDAELLWHQTVLPEFRGHRLQMALMLSMMRWRRRSGIRHFFINCRDYNTPSRKNIVRAGFRPVGYYEISKITGMQQWHPL